MIDAIFRDDCVVVAVDNYPYTVSIDDMRYDEVVEAIEDEDDDALRDLLIIKHRYSRMRNELVEEGIEDAGDGEYSYKGNPIPMDLGDYLRSALDNSETGYKPIVRFIQRLYDNPNHDTRMRLFGFMEHNKMPISADGRFLAFKSVKPDYMDTYTGTVYNGPGAVVPRMGWSDVDTDNERTCSRGYHACSKDYLASGYYNESRGDRIVSVAIAPEDVGAIPSDYNNSKLRCRQYQVLADVTDQYLRERGDVKLRRPSNDWLEIDMDDDGRAGSYWPYD